MRLYLKYFSIHLRSAMQYKTSFFFMMVGQFLTAFSTFLGIYFMFTRFHRVEGFTFSEVLLCFSVVIMAFSIVECFVRGFDHFGTTISNGEFDRIMVRPRNEVLQVLGSKIDFTRLGRFFEAAVVMAYAVPSSGVHWTAVKILTLCLMIVGGVALFSGLFLIYASFCFFTIEGLEFMNIFTDGGREFGRYPLKVYGDKVLKFFTFIVPLACVQYYPLTVLIGRSESVWDMTAPLWSFIFLFPCMAIKWFPATTAFKARGA